MVLCLDVHHSILSSYDLSEALSEIKYLAELKANSYVTEKIPDRAPGRFTKITYELTG